VSHPAHRAQERADGVDEGSLALDISRSRAALHVVVMKPASVDIF